MHMIERLKQATETCEEADRFALLNQNPKRFGERLGLVTGAQLFQIFFAFPLALRVTVR